jgi:solute carrier family 25 oxoglutarate transporter 11
MSLPFDNIKTKLQKMKVGADGLYPYKGVPDCFAKTVAREGFFGLWVGFPVYYSRVAPHAMIVII